MQYRFAVNFGTLSYIPMFLTSNAILSRRKQIFMKVEISRVFVYNIITNRNLYVWLRSGFRGGDYNKYALPPQQKQGKDKVTKLLKINNSNRQKSNAYGKIQSLTQDFVYKQNFACMRYPTISPQIILKQLWIRIKIILIRIRPIR